MDILEKFALITMCIGAIYCLWILMGADFIKFVKKIIAEKQKAELRRIRMKVHIQEMQKRMKNNRQVIEFAKNFTIE